MMFTCRTRSGRQAETMGLANACVADTELETAIDNLTSEILANSSFSHAADKRLLTETDGLPQRAGLAREIYRGEGVGPDMSDRIQEFTRRSTSRQAPRKTWGTSTPCELGSTASSSPRTSSRAGRCSQPFPKKRGEALDHRPELPNSAGPGVAIAPHR